MKERYKWPVYGVLLGLVTSIISRYMMLRQAGLDISIGKMVGNPLSIWARTLAPVVLGLVFFYIGISRDRLMKIRKDMEEKNKELQKKLIEQSMQLGTALNNTMEELNRYTDQLDKIVNNIKAGVCLVNSDLTIEEGFNNALIVIFGNKDYLNGSIFNTIFNMIDEEKKNETSEFLKQCFSNATASDSMLSAANPMEEFTYLYLEGGSAVSKIIKMGMVRLRSKDRKIEKLLLLFDDVTVERELENSIRQKEAEYDKKYSIIVSLLGNDREVTRQFIADLGENMKNLSLYIKKLKQNEMNDTLLDEIIGMIHSIKGEAFSLDFKTLAKESSLFERYLKDRKGQVLDLEMNLEIVNFFEKMSNEYAALEKIIKDLTSFIYADKQESRGKASSKSVKPALEESVRKHLAMNDGKRSVSLLEKELRIVTDKTASAKGKSVILDFVSRLDGIDAEVYVPLKEALIHLVRNSIDHGIETLDERKKSGKPESGTIRIMVNKTQEGIHIEYSDDGKGFNMKRIKEKAVEKNLVDEQTIEKMNNMDIIKLVFRDGFSTSDDVDMVSGMGAGMSVVKKNIIGKLKGKLGITNRVAKGIVLKMNIPR